MPNTLHVTEVTLLYVCFIKGSSSLEVRGSNISIHTDFLNLISKIVFGLEIVISGTIDRCFPR